MFKKIFTFSFLLGFVCSSLALSPSDALSKKLKSFKTYSAHFSQVTTSSNNRVVQKSSGLVWIMPPGRFRWETKKPTQQTLVTNGKTLWIYDVGLAQVTQAPLNEKVRVNPAALLSGSVSVINQDFIVSFTKNAAITDFILKPKTERISFKSIMLRFDGDKLIEMEVKNNLDEITHFTFSEIRLDDSIAESFFNFDPPKDVDVVKQ